MQSVIVFAPGNERGGAAAHIHTMAKYTRDCQTVHFSFVLLGEGPLTDALRDLGVEVTVLTGGLRQSLKGLGQAVQRKRNPILHSHGPRLNILSSIVARRIGCLWTVTIHSNPYFDFLGSRLKSAIFPKLHIRGLRRVSGAFTVNPQFSSLLPTKTIWYVPNAIEVPELKESKSAYQEKLRHQLGVTSDIQFIGLAARFDPVKNIPLLIDALRFLPPHVHLALAGDGGQYEELLAKVAALGMQNRVHFLGFIHSLDVFYAGLHGHVLPSKSEGLPSCLLEAGAMGTANIGSDIPGIRQVIDDGLTGLIVPVGNSEALAAAVKRLLAEPRVAQALVENFRTQVLPKYQPKKMIAAYLDGYREIGIR